MRIIALIANIALLAFVVYTFSEDGMPSADEALIVSLVILVPILNIYTIYTTVGGDWVSLWFRRKALEETKKIQRLNDQK